MADLSLNAADVPILDGEMVSAPGNCCASMNPIINQLPSTIPTAHVISSAGCEAADNAHFDSEGYRILGERYAQTMLTLLDPSIISNTTELTTKGLSLHNIYPNPVLDNTINIAFDTPSRAYVSVKLFSPSGVEVSEIAGREFAPGEHTIKHVTQNLSADTYYCVLRADGFVRSKQIIIQ